MICSYFFLFHRFPFHSVHCFFWCAEVFKFDVISFVLLLLSVLLMWSKKSLQNLMSWNFPLYFLLGIFSFGLICRSLINFEFIFCIWCNGPTLFFCVWISSFHTICRKPVFSPLYSLGILVKDRLTIYVRLYFWAVCSVLLVCVPVFMPASHCFDYCTFVTYFEIRK